MLLHIPCWLRGLARLLLLALRVIQLWYSEVRDESGDKEGVEYEEVEGEGKHRESAKVR